MKIILFYIETPNDKYGKIISNDAKRYTEPKTTYNFEVGDFHTYYVGTGVLVHNKGCGSTIDSATGEEVGRFIVDENGNVLIEPVGGSTYSPNGTDVHTTYPNESNYNRLNPAGHKTNPTPHAHGHLKGTGKGMSGQGPSIDIYGNIVNRRSPAAHWTIKFK